MKKKLEIYILLCYMVLPINSWAQTGLNLTTQAWPSSWITHPEIKGDEFGVYLFRKSFDLAEVPKTFPVHISADNRYQLFVNGEYVGNGPARGMLQEWYYDTYDLIESLKSGENTIAVRVWNYAEQRPVAQISYRTGLIVQGGLQETEVVNTGNNGWKVIKNSAYTPIPISQEQVMGYFVAGPGERFDANENPWGWEEIDFDDNLWKKSKPLYNGYPSKGIFEFGLVPSYLLFPREIPAMEESEEELGVLRRSKPKINQENDIIIPSQSKATLLFDHSQLTTAYLKLAVKGGKGASIKSVYAETLRNSDKAKGNRNDIENKEIYGFHDVFFADGQDRVFRTLWWRTFRYVQLEIETQDEPLTIKSLKCDFTAYPFEEKAIFTVNNTFIEKAWDISWRTQRLCAGETYFDCPYYEQLQYVGDTRVQALISLYVSGDHKLYTQAIKAFYNSRLPLGLTQSRFPSNEPQIIPTYSLLWIAMLNDYYWHVPDPQTVKIMLPAIDDIFSWYEQRMTADSLTGLMEWWSYVDVSPDPNWANGRPRGSEQGGSALLSLQYAYALQKAAELFDEFGNKAQASIYKERANRINEKVVELCWNENKGLLADFSDKKTFSQHTNIIAILTDAFDEEQQKQIMENVLNDKSIAPSAYYFFFYLTRALEKVGEGEEYLSLLSPWKSQIELGLTTFAENPEPTRSDCHAWSATPVYEMLALISGIQPNSPGFKTVRIAPNLNGLGQIETKMPHYKGEIAVYLKETKNNRLSGYIDLPIGLSGTFSWKGTEKPLVEGRNEITIIDKSK